jgi:hypothetical protein
VLTYVLLGTAAAPRLPVGRPCRTAVTLRIRHGPPAVALIPRYGVLDLDVLNPKPVLWLFAARLGGRARGHGLAAGGRHGRSAATVPGFFDEPARDAVILAGVLVLLWVPTVRWPAVLHGATGVLASASLYIYVTHWQVYPRVAELSPLLAVIASVGFGIAYAAVAGAVFTRLPGRRRAPAAPATR